MTFENTLDVAVIGAGPAGLTLARRLAATNTTFKVFEKNADVGGIWDINAPNSPMYESAHFISSRTKSGFPGFPMPDSYPDYPKHDMILRYIQDFADTYNLRRHVRFNTGVARARQDTAGEWTLTLDSGNTVHCKYLICANGVTWIPNEVSWPGTFTGEVRHAVSYRSADEFAGKRVLIVGAGNSGVDIACDASFAADQAFISLRRGYHFIPKYLFGKPSDVFASEGPQMPHWLKTRVFTALLRMINGDITNLGLPKPDHALLESHPLMNTQILHYLGHGDCIAKPDIEAFDGDHVVFSDGSREKIDLVITATGYQHSSPYLEQGVLNQQNGRPDMYLNLFPRKTDNLAVLGFVEFSSAAYQNFDRMAELIVADAVAPSDSALKQTLSQLKSEHRPDLRNGHRYIDSARHSNYIEVEGYLKLLDGLRKKLGLSDSSLVPPEPQPGDSPSDLLVPETIRAQVA